MVKFFNEPMNDNEIFDNIHDSMLAGTYTASNILFYLSIYFFKKIKNTWKFLDYR